MVSTASSFLTVVLESLMFFLLITVLYYAARFLTSFKRGMLEQGWKLLSQGIIIIVGGEIILAISNYILSLAIPSSLEWRSMPWESSSPSWGSGPTTEYGEWTTSAWPVKRKKELSLRSEESPSA
jgi:hypothetical protein